MAAARGLRETDQGVEPIADPELVRQNRQLGRKVAAYALGTAVVTTALFTIASVPGR